MGLFRRKRWDSSDDLEHTFERDYGGSENPNEDTVVAVRNPALQADQEQLIFRFIVGAMLCALPFSLAAFIFSLVAFLSGGGDDEISTYTEWEPTHSVRAEIAARQFTYWRTGGVGYPPIQAETINQLADVSDSVSLIGGGAPDWGSRESSADVSPIPAISPRSLGGSDERYMYFVDVYDGDRNTELLEVLSFVVGEDYISPPTFSTLLENEGVATLTPTAPSEQDVGEVLANLGGVEGGLPTSCTSQDGIRISSGLADRLEDYLAAYVARNQTELVTIAAAGEAGGWNEYAREGFEYVAGSSEVACVYEIAELREVAEISFLTYNPDTGSVFFEMRDVVFGVDEGFPKVWGATLWLTGGQLEPNDAPPPVEDN